MALHLPTVNLTLDIGNTSTSAAIFNGAEIVIQAKIQKPEELERILVNYRISACAVSNVNADDQIPQVIRALSPITVDHKTNLPITVEYSTPETLGSDRICAAIGGHALYPNNTVLTVDLGTCIKYELITSDGIYKGGNIAPGMKMRYKSLATGTANLPLIKAANRYSDFGRSTEEAIINGVQLGIECEIEAMIERSKALFPDLITIMTGGDLPHFDKALKTTIFAHPLLVLHGLNEIILFNQSN
ncbi:MAG: type III pantothenate kinase [Granulosicoccus sp.]|jgi:type III pantothenate kinase